MLNENLWNQSKQLSPTIRKFSADGQTFKRQPRNLEKIPIEEREEVFQRSMHNLL